MQDTPLHKLSCLMPAQAAGLVLMSCSPFINGETAPNHTEDLLGLLTPSFFGTCQHPENIPPTLRR